jgi:hypothetical protein
MTRDELVKGLSQELNRVESSNRLIANKFEKIYYKDSPICPMSWFDLEGSRVKLLEWGGYDKVSALGPYKGAVAHEEGDAVGYIWDGEIWCELKDTSFGAELEIRRANLRKLEDLEFCKAVISGGLILRTAHIRDGAYIITKKGESGDT